MCDSLGVVFDSRRLGDGGDDGEGSWILRRSAPAKKGRRVLERMCLRTAASQRELSDTRAEEVGFARFFHNPNVSVEEILASAAERTAQAAAGREVLLIEDSSEINYQSKAGRNLGQTNPQARHRRMVPARRARTACGLLAPTLTVGR